MAKKEVVGNPVYCETCEFHGTFQRELDAKTSNKRFYAALISVFVAFAYIAYFFVDLNDKTKREYGALVEGYNKQKEEISDKIFDIRVKQTVIETKLEI